MKALYKRLLSLTYCVITAPLVTAELFKWQDAEGKTHYADSQPRYIQSELITRNMLPYVHGQKVLPRQAKKEVVQHRIHRMSVPKQKTSGGRQHCVLLKKQMATIDERLSNGYKEPVGNQLRRRRRELTSLYRKRCH